MLKLFVLSALLALATARPGLLHGSAIATAALPSAAIIGSVPTAISSHSSSIIHSAAIAASPVIHAAPVVAAPAPFVHAAPAAVLPAPSILTAPHLSSGFVAAPAIGLGHGVASFGHGLSSFGHGLHY